MAELKDAVDVMLRVLLRQITNLLDKKSMDLVIVEGEAINAYFEEKPIFKTHDYDLRLTHKDIEVMHLKIDDPTFVKIYKELERQRDLTFEYVLKQLNRLIDESKIPSILSKRGFELVRSENGYFYEDTSERLKFRRSIVYLFKRDNGGVEQETLIDYVIYTPVHFSQFLDFVSLAMEPIPYVTIDGLKYAFPKKRFEK